VLDDHAHPIPLQFRAFDLAELSLDIDGGAEAAAVRVALTPTRLVVEQMKVAIAALLGCDADEAVTRRDHLASADWPGWVRRLIADAGIRGVIIDGGPESLGRAGVDAQADLTGVAVWELARAEAVVDPLVAAGATAAEILVAVDDLIETAQAGGAVGLKTVIAYRTGLAIDPAVSSAAAEASLRGAATESPPRRAKALRDLVFVRLLQHSAERGLPLQVHTGFGDSEIRLADADPLLLDDVLRTPVGQAASVVLIHGSWPWHEQAAYLASVRRNVWAEVSLFNLFTPATCADRLLRIIDTAPTGRILVGTDGHGQPETHWFAARTLQLAWAVVRARLEGSVRERWLDDTARRIFDDNAVALYHL
jgi:predicted TIM-barrel fold metal-dependent hydrolase